MACKNPLRLAKIGHFFVSDATTLTSYSYLKKWPIAGQNPIPEQAPNLPPAHTLPSSLAGYPNGTVLKIAGTKGKQKQRSTGQWGRWRLMRRKSVV
jgi:hypothetical protein